MNRHYTVIGVSNRPGNPLPMGAAALLPAQSVFSGGDRHYGLVRFRGEAVQTASRETEC